jgi:histidinol phosphatase-like enzyme (inositol monophosphatase family)
MSDELLSFAGELADAARATILPYFRAAHAIEDKGAKNGAVYDPVTEADKAAERAMRTLIEARYPQHGILGEEFDEKPSQDGHLWVLDPIDGTRAFIAGLPLWGVLIGLVREGKPTIGVIDQPYIGERFRGWPGGADLHTRDGVRPLRVRDCAALGEARLATTDPALFAGAETAAFEAVRGQARLIRYGCDCYAYAMIAVGGLDCVIESGLAPWDAAALVPVVEGAGGSVTDWRGKPLSDRDFFRKPTARAQVLAAGDKRVRDGAISLLGSAAT